MKRFTLTDKRLHEMRWLDSGMTSDPALLVVLSRAGLETAPGDYELVDGEWQSVGPQPTEEWVSSVLQLLSRLLSQDGPYKPTADNSYQDPALKSWAEEARWVVHYALEGDLGEYIELRLKELGPYVSPSELCSYCGRRLTAKEVALLDRYHPGDAERLCDPCADPLAYPEEAGR
jgi:hypothetical protein